MSTNQNTISTRRDQTIESVLLDVDLFIKYQSSEKALSLLKEAIERSPMSILLREKMLEVCASQGYPAEAARQCLALANLYIKREEFNSAYDRLQEAKMLDSRISIASGLEAIRRAKHPELAMNYVQQRISTDPAARDAVFSGNLSLISIFDAIQVVENSKLTGSLILKDDVSTIKISFNSGQIVDAEANVLVGHLAFRQAVSFTSGMFEFVLSQEEFPVVIEAVSNTNLILDTLSELDEENKQDV